MDVNITVEEDMLDYTVTINGQEIIQTTTTGKYDQTIDKWVPAIERVYFKKRRCNEALVVGLSVMPTEKQCWTSSTKKEKSEQGFDSLNICIGSHCLVISLEPWWDHETQIRGSLKDFLSNPRVIFAGVGIDRVVEKLKNANKIAVVPKTVDLGLLAEQALGRDDLGRYNLERLAKLVLGDDMEVKKPHWRHMNTVDDIMYSTVDAFLSYKIAERCTEILRDREKKP